LHLRPLTAFAALAQKFESRVTVTRSGKSADGKSPFEMFLMVSPPGVELTIEASGPDARGALEALVALLHTADEQAGAEPPLPDPPQERREPSCGSVAPENR
jgi:phosphotransferase system HPr (HPr) family protein